MENTGFETTRRGFLKGAALAIAGAGVAGLAGCAPQSESDGASAAAGAASSADAASIAWDEEFDVVIIGAGAAGMTAAITVAREGNGKTCLLAEKESQPNGNSPFCAGDFSWTTVPDDYYTYLKELAGEHTTTPDVGMRYGHTNFGGAWPWQAMPADGGWFIFDADGLAAGAIPAETSADPVADKLAYSADSLADLAKQIDVPAEELERTVAEWNKFCAEGGGLRLPPPARDADPRGQGAFLRPVLRSHAAEHRWRPGAQPPR